MIWVACLFPIKRKILPGYWHSKIRASSVCFIIEQHFDFIIVNVKNALCNSNVIPNGRSLLKVISEIIGNSVLILSPNLFNKCLNKTQVSNINGIFPPSNISQLAKCYTIWYLHDEEWWQGIITILFFPYLNHYVFMRVGKTLSAQDKHNGSSLTIVWSLSRDASSRNTTCSDSTWNQCMHVALHSCWELPPKAVVKLHNLRREPGRKAPRIQDTFELIFI